MAALGRIFTRIFFWIYERGTVPYDIAVGAILIFVLLTPRSWFSDRPQLGSPSSEAGVVLIADDPVTGMETFRVDPRTLALPIPEPELERLLHDAVRKNVPDLKGRSFMIEHFTPVMGQDGQLKYYEVKVKF